MVQDKNFEARGSDDPNLVGFKTRVKIVNQPTGDGGETQPMEALDTFGFGADFAGRDWGLRARSHESPGVIGESTGQRGTFGSGGTNDDVVGLSKGSGRSGVWGNNSLDGNGVTGSSRQGDGVVGLASNDAKSGVFGSNDHKGNGVAGFSENGVGVRGWCNLGDGIEGSSIAVNKSGVWGHHDGTNFGYGVAGTSANGIGVFGLCSSEKESAIRGINTAIPRQIPTGGPGGALSRILPTGRGVLGRSEGGPGLSGSSLHGNGVEGKSEKDADGVHGESNGGYGVNGISRSGVGVLGSSGDNFGVLGESNNNCGGAFRGRKANLLLQPMGTRGSPTSDRHDGERCS
jgi:hypothetical protein